RYEFKRGVLHAIDFLWVGDATTVSSKVSSFATFCIDNFGYDYGVSVIELDDAVSNNQLSPFLFWPNGAFVCNAYVSRDMSGRNKDDIKRVYFLRVERDSKKPLYQEVLGKAKMNNIDRTDIDQAFVDAGVESLLKRS